MYGRGKNIAISTVGDTRWNSIQGCFASQFCIRHACKLFAIRYKNHPKFPKQLACWEKDDFWKDVEEAKLLVCDASYLLQQTCNTLAHVFLVFVNLTIHLMKFCAGCDYQQELLQNVNKCWNAEEQPLFLLAFLLHPQYREVGRHLFNELNKDKGSWAMDKNCLSEGCLQQAIVFYYAKHKLAPVDTNWESEKKNLARQFTVWITGGVKLDDTTFTSYEGEYPAEWWITHSSELPQLFRFAIFLLSAPVQGADCERLFKDLALFHTKARNRMHVSTTFESTAVAHSMQRKYPSDYLGNSGVKTKKDLLTLQNIICLMLYWRHQVKMPSLSGNHLNQITNNNAALQFR